MFEKVQHKPIVWMHGEVKTPPFSSSARVEAGVLLRRLQRGENLGMPESRPMPTIGRGCHELRIPDSGVVWRILYFVASDAIVILEVFGKKTRQTPLYVLKAAARRLKAYRRLTEGKLT
jgi:phage-related protein